MADSVLTDRQKLFLKEIGGNKWLCENFYLTGGTALAGFYLQHRYSEDLDFFSQEEFDPMQIDIFLKDVKPKLGFKEVDFQQSFNRNLFFLKYDDEVIKTEFTYFPFPRIEKGEVRDGVAVDSLLDIAVNKVFTIHQQARARDFIDLYFLCREKGFEIADLIKKAKIKFDWHIDQMQLGTQFLKAYEVEDFPQMIKELPNEEWQQFFMDEAKKFESDVID